MPAKATQWSEWENPDSNNNRARSGDAQIDDGIPGSGITATAGAIIYKDGAQGTIQGTVDNNRADTGGIMVSGQDATVRVVDGATISKNVGATFGGGSTAEQGGQILMTGGTMSENVAWFGGGAVNATQNGVDWLLGRMAEGNATPATPDVAGPVRGIALRRADAAAGDVQVEGAPGCYLFENDGSITAGDIFAKDARVVDCHTVGITGTRTAGRIFDVTEEGVFVEIGKRT